MFCAVELLLFTVGEDECGFKQCAGDGCAAPDSRESVATVNLALELLDHLTVHHGVELNHGLFHFFSSAFFGTMT